jgi:hypothetical protein
VCTCCVSTKLTAVWGCMSSGTLSPSTSSSSWCFTSAARCCVEVICRAAPHQYTAISSRGATHKATSTTNAAATATATASHPPTYPVHPALPEGLGALGLQPLAPRVQRSARPGAVGAPRGHHVVVVQQLRA